MASQTSVAVSRNTLLRYAKRDLYMSKETYIYGKRVLYVNHGVADIGCGVQKHVAEVCQKRPIYVKRDLYMWQKVAVSRNTGTECVLLL
jgi:hypothetical protein